MDSRRCRSEIEARWYSWTTRVASANSLSSFSPPSLSPSTGICPRAKGAPLAQNVTSRIDKTGCQWRAFPRDFPNWHTVESYYRRWRLVGVWRRIHEALRGQVRLHLGREVSPSAAIIDSQTVK